jgi:hypothetical protein
MSLYLHGSRLWDMYEKHRIGEMRYAMQAEQEWLSMSSFCVGNGLDHVRLRGGPM